MANLKCPCCGKELYQMACTEVFARQLAKAIQEHPEDVGELIVGMFAIMHNPEAGELLSDEEIKELGLGETERKHKAIEDFLGLEKLDCLPTRTRNALMRFYLWRETEWRRPEDMSNIELLSVTGVGQKGLKAIRQIFGDGTTTH